MLNAIIRFSVRNKLLVGLCTLGLLVAGIFHLKQLPIDALPDITSNQVQVITVSPALAAPEVERLVTFPLEQACANIPGITEMRSISRFGLSVLTVVFNDHTDVYWARQQVAERLMLAKENIPPEAGTPELAPPTTGIGEIYQYILKPKKGYEGKYDLAELRSIQDWIVRRQLLGTPGVADVSSFGGYLKQYEVAVIPGQLKSMNVTMAEVFEALENNNQNAGGAYIEHGPTALFIKTEGLAKSIKEIEQTVVKYTPDGTPVFIRDVAKVQTGHTVRYGAMTYKDEGEVAGAVVLMLKNANASQVIELVKMKVEEIKKTLPEGVELETFYDRTKMVDRAIKTVKTNLIEGALIVLLVLIVFLGNWRAGLIVASVIPLAMLFAVIMMNLFGVSGNLMSLGALDFGLIVDGAVIIIEAVLHRLAHNRLLPGTNAISKEQLNAEVEQAAGKMMNAAVFGQIIILIVYLPILTLTGIEGKMFKPMAQTVAFALIGAFILSLTYVPMIASMLLSRKPVTKENFADRMMNRLKKLYQPVLGKALQFPKTIITATIVLFALAIFTMSRLGGEFIPEMEEGDFAVDARLLTGSSLTETIKVTQQAVHILQNKFPEVEKIVTRIGASEIPTDPMPLEMTDIMISLKPKSEWTSASSFEELANKMSNAMKVIPGLTSGFQFPVQMRFNELISGAKQDVVCKIFGEDLDSLAAIAGKLGTVVGSVDGAKDIYIETVTGLPQIVVEYKRELLAQYRLSIAGVNRLIRAAFAGDVAGTVYENERRYDLVVRMDKSQANSLESVQNLLIATPSGDQIPLYLVADVSIKEGANQIQRENAQRRIMVGFNIRNRDVESVVHELDNKVQRQLKLPPGYSIQYGGQFENLVNAKATLSIAVPAALLLILVMLYFAFGSVKYSILIFSAIPLSAIGGVFALWLRGMPFSISAGVGFIALFGVAVLNGIVLIAEFNKLKEQQTDIKNIIMQGALVRLRPVLMTAAVASLGFLPMALSQGAGAEVQRPLATVVIGGLISATILTLVILPIIYNLMERKPKRKTKTTAAAILIPALLLTGFANAQDNISLDSAIQQALRNNLSLQAVKEQQHYWKAMASNTVELPKTEIGAEYGGISSIKNDSRFFISQGFGLPVIYSRQKKYYEAELNTQGHYTRSREAALVQEVKYTFYHLVYLLETEKLFIELDSTYKNLLHTANIRQKTGETDQLDVSAINMQLLQFSLQKEDLQKDKTAALLQLQRLCNSAAPQLPVYTSFKKEMQVNDNTGTGAHSLLAYTQSNEMAANAFTQTEQSRLTPDISIGYSNQSIIGYQSADGVNQQYYDAGHRFHTVNATVAIPIFNQAAKAKIKAARSKETIAKKQTAATAQELDNNLQTATRQLQINSNMITQYETIGLAQAQQVLQYAQQNFRAGNISYAEWTALAGNAINTRIQYQQAIKNYNYNIIQLEYLLSN
ncbi:CusA/CzcA family heavy metal efflux RND transporter [Terrimonas rubra]|uniref:CusA/CzcA family heavy metal efflux RND transporter n=1 Tax=Terrimonas rubra TaxID=1035890 RepID=A0ABW6A9Y9_9BACT